MSLPQEAPRLPKPPFVVIDLLCLAAAAYLALTAPAPLGGGSLIAVVVLVALGACALAVPFITDYGRKTEAALTERQQQIAALAQSTAASAEQISIAAASLHSIGESVSRSAKAIESLPQKLQERIAEFNARLNEATASDTEELEQELQTLRSAESDRLVTAIDQLAATARELGRLETLIQSHAARAADAVAALPRLAEQAVGKSADGLAQSLASARREIDTLLTQQRSLFATTASGAAAQHAAALESLVARATADLETTCGSLIGRMTARIESAQHDLAEGDAPDIRPSASTQSTGVAARKGEEQPRTSPPAPESFTPASPPTHKPGAPSEAQSRTTAHTLFQAPMAARKSDQTAGAPDEESTADADTDLPELQSTVISSPRSPREPFDEDSFDDELEEAESISALTEDGSTRLLVTAYIGIGNKLYVRGSGAGLSWEKGVPLQFVSIGKWRWEASDVQRPIAVRLYKNDQVECVSIGTLTLEPGRQRELVATF